MKVPSPLLWAAVTAWSIALAFVAFTITNVVQVLRMGGYW